MKAMITIFMTVCTLTFTAVSHAQVQIETWTTQAGTKVLFTQAPQLPMLDIEVTFDAGSARDNKDYGLANFAAGLIGMKTKSLNEDQIAEGFNKIGAQFGGDAGRDKSSFSLRTLTRQPNQRQAIKQFVEVLAQAEFPAEIFERERRRLQTSLQQKAVNPNAISTDLLWQKLYGDHPYSHPVSGTAESLQALTPKKIEQFYQQYYVASNAVIAMVGDIDVVQAKQISEHISSQLLKGSKAKPIVPVMPLKKSREHIHEFSSSQTHFSLAQVGVERGHPDYIPLFLGNHLFGGGGFGSYLMEEVREKRGLVYSVYSYFAPMRQKGPFVIGLSTSNATARDAQKVVTDTLLAFLKDFDQERFEASKSNLVGGFPLRMDSNSKKLGYLSLIGFYDLPLDYLEWFPQQVEKTTKQQVIDAWQRHVKPNSMLTLMVGQPE
jgi:zinc protease